MSFEGENVFIRAPDAAKARLTVRLPWWLNLADDGAHTHTLTHAQHTEKFHGYTGSTTGSNRSKSWPHLIAVQ